MTTTQEIIDHAKSRFPGHVEFSYDGFERSLSSERRIAAAQRTPAYQRQRDIEDLCLMDWGLARSLIFVGLNEEAECVKYRYCDNAKPKDAVERERRRLFPSN